MKEGPAPIDFLNVMHSLIHKMINEIAPSQTVKA